MFYWLINAKSSAGGRGMELGLQTDEPNGSLSRPAGRCGKKKKNERGGCQIGM